MCAGNGVEVYNAQAVVAWTDLDLSATIGAKASLVYLGVTRGGMDPGKVSFRKNGNTEDYSFPVDNDGSVASVDPTNAHYMVAIVPTDSAGIIEHIADNLQNIVIKVLAYIN